MSRKPYYEKDGFKLINGDWDEKIDIQKNINYVMVSSIRNKILILDIFR